MDGKDDFFSPEMVDERLEFTLHQRMTDVLEQDMAGADSNLRLISDLRYLYGAEGTENVRSLQRVWEHLQEYPAQTERLSSPGRCGLPAGPGSCRGERKRERHLYLLKPSEECKAVQKLGSRRGRGKGLAVLAALLFLIVMVGSVLTIVHLRAMGKWW